MNIREYLSILEDLGVDVAYLTERLEVNSGRALRMKDGRKALGGGVYFNRNRDGVVHFTINSTSTVGRHNIDWNLWSDLPDDKVKTKDQGKPNIYPRRGKERLALDQLLRDDAHSTRPVRALADLNTSSPEPTPNLLSRFVRWLMRKLARFRTYSAGY